MDGKIATATGESMYITGEEARRHVHQTRGACMGIMAGIGTVLADDPMLNCRLPDSKDPMRIICDDMLRIPLECRILKTAGEIPTVIATLGGDRTKREQCERLGAKLLTLPAKDGRLDLRELMRRLGEMGIDSILLEGGGTLNEAALKAGIVQRIQAYIAPKLLGGADAKTPVEGEGIRSLQAAYRLNTPEISRLGEDILLESEVEPCLPES